MVPSVFSAILLFDTFHLFHSRHVEQKICVVTSCNQINISSSPPLLRLIYFVQSRIGK